MISGFLKFLLQTREFHKFFESFFSCYALYSPVYLRKNLKAFTIIYKAQCPIAINSNCFTYKIFFNDGTDIILTVAIHSLPFLQKHSLRCKTPLHHKIEAQ